MERDKIEALLAEKHNIQVAAIRPDGRPQVTPNSFYWDGEKFYISTTKRRRKYHNLKRDPRVQLVVDDPSRFRAALIDGTAEIIEDIEEQLPFYLKIMEKNGNTSSDPEATRERLVKQDRVMIVVTPEKAPEDWTAWDNG